MQAYERSHPLACIICEPKIKRIIEDRDSKMREKIWADATSGRAIQDSDSTLGVLPVSRIARVLRDSGFDVDLWTWRMQCLGWILGTFTFYSVGFFKSPKYAVVGLLGHRMVRNWLPWWYALRFRKERMFGEEHWHACERIIWFLRSIGAIMRIFPTVPVTIVVLVTEVLVSTVLTAKWRVMRI
jgi:hypothetical protein